MSEPIADRNPLVQRVRRLVRQRSERRAEGVYVVEGPQLVDEALAAGRDVEVIVVPESAASGPTARAAGHHGVRCVVVADRVFDSLSSTRSAQPALAVVADHDVALADLPADTLLVLAELADPGNVGTLVRSAEAFGVSGVVFAGGVDPYNPKVVRATAGSLFRMPHARLDGDHAPVAARPAGGGPRGCPGRARGWGPPGSPAGRRGPGVASPPSRSPSTDRSPWCSGASPTAFPPRCWVRAMAGSRCRPVAMSNR